jgi:hypothetical protein
MAGEIDAMKAIDTAMESLEPDETKRVLRWAVDKFGASEVNLDVGPPRGLRRTPSDGQQPAFERISDLMDAALPNSIVDHVLVASYWFQVIQGRENFTGQEVNSELKDLGHPASNITDSYTTLMKRKPPAVRQVQKTGSTRQARKLYRLTNEGVRAVERMLRGDHED